MTKVTIPIAMIAARVPKMIRHHFEQHHQFWFLIIVSSSAVPFSRSLAYPLMFSDRPSKDSVVSTFWAILLMFSLCMSLISSVCLRSPWIEERLMPESKSENTFFSRGFMNFCIEYSFKASCLWMTASLPSNWSFSCSLQSFKNR